MAKKNKAGAVALAPVPKQSTKDRFTKTWIIDNALPIIQAELSNGLTVRGLYYRLVAAGMTNSTNHYKRVVSAMTDARWDGVVDMAAFIDRERETVGYTNYRETNVEDSADYAKSQIKAWATSYSKNRWENQPYYVEVFVEKKSVQGIFEKPCRNWEVALSPCKGYPSLTFLNELKNRFDRVIAEGKKLVVFYFGDYDCSGEDIPRSIVENLERMGTKIDLRRIALMKKQVIAWKLPPAPTKPTDSRGAKWGGLGQVEIEAVEPKKLQQLCDNAIKSLFDEKLFDELKQLESIERAQFKGILREDFNDLLD